MTYEPPQPDEQPTGLSAAVDDLRRIRRSSDDTVIAGVLGGLGRRFGIDPVVLRVITVVLAIFGGTGVLLYALGWLLLPQENGRSLLDEARDRATGPAGSTEYTTSADESPKSSSSSLALAIVLGIVIVFSASNVVIGSWDGTVLLLLTAAGLYALTRRRDTADTATGDWSWPAAAGTGTAAGAPMAGATPPPTQAGHPAYPAGNPDGWPEGPDWDPDRIPSAWDSAPPGAAWEAAVPATPVSTAPDETVRRAPTAITLTLAALAAVAVFVNDVTWADMPSGMYVVAPLAVVGLGLLASIRRGRTKGLVATGILLSVLLVPATAIGHITVVDDTIRPTTLAEIQGATVDIGAGEVTYDLSDVPFTPTDEASMTFDQGVGTLTITVPERVDVTVRYNGGLGEVRIFGERFEGAVEERTVTDLGSDGTGGGSLTLDVTFGVGELEVSR